jgi:hypothetical protein
LPSLPVPNPSSISTSQSPNRCITYAIKASPLLKLDIVGKWYDSDEYRVSISCNITTLLPPPLLPCNDDELSARDDDDDDIKDARVARLTSANNPSNNPSRHQPYLILSSNA